MSSGKLRRRCLTLTPWTLTAVRAAMVLRQKTSSAVTPVRMCERHIAVEAGPSRTQVYGFLEVNKVAGNFHFAPGKSFQQSHVHVHDLQSFGLDNINMTHYIRHLSFGEDYPGIVNPLDRTNVTALQASMMFQYFVKVVPTVYMKLDGKVLRTNQFSVTRHEKVANGLLGDQGLPGVFVLYELSPMMVKLTEKHRSFTHFLTGVCAIIGGMFTVAGLIDSLIYHSARAIQKKIDLGKTT
uniref:Endoplasmic reticulum-Golgi intermediate compartment protein n=1 Tax=Molossus molossus TaxID=27622 RepID=A0A7J8HFX2_MOLMO|nr:ERGIC and golgi 3 [Molossus molossus]